MSEGRGKLPVVRQGGRIVIIATPRGISVIHREAFLDDELNPDFPLRPTGGPEKLDLADQAGIVRSNQLSQGELERASELLRCIGEFGVEDLDCEDGVVDRAIYRKREALVPDRGS